MHNLILDMIQNFDAVLLSDYDKGFLTPEFTREVIKRCNRRSIPCVADVKRGPELYQGAILKSNLDWTNKYGASNVTTRGAMWPWVHGKTDRYHGGRHDVKCVNHVGAGDCFAAHLTLALACGFSLEDAAAVAHSAGRVYVQHPHNRPPHPKEIAADMGNAVIRA